MPKICWTVVADDIHFHISFCWRWLTWSLNCSITSNNPTPRPSRLRRLPLKLDLPTKFCSETIFLYVCSLTFVFLRERERKTVSLLLNNLSSNWFSFHFCSATIELCCRYFNFLSKVALSCHIILMDIKRSTLRLSIYFTKICFNSQFLCNTIKKNMITLKRRELTNCNHLLLCCLIVKLTHIVYKNISYGILLLPKQLFEMSELFWNKLSKNWNCFVTKYMNPWIGESSLTNPLWLRYFGFHTWPECNRLKTATKAF